MISVRVDRRKKAPGDARNNRSRAIAAKSAAIADRWAAIGSGIAISVRAVRRRKVRGGIAINVQPGHPRKVLGGIVWDRRRATVLKVDADRSVETSTVSSVRPDHRRKALGDDAWSRRRLIAKMRALADQWAATATAINARAAQPKKARGAAWNNRPQAKLADRWAATVFATSVQAVHPRKAHGGTAINVQPRHRRKAHGDAAWNNRAPANADRWATGIKDKANRDVDSIKERKGENVY